MVPAICQIWHGTAAVTQGNGSTANVEHEDPVHGGDVDNTGVGKVIVQAMDPRAIKSKEAAPRVLK